METVDLRSDTVTQPTESMRRAMSSAEVGDDVMGEDPTINRLERLGAEKMGKEAAIFVPSGTMGNLLAVLTHCNRGDEAIMGNLGHTFLFEVGGIAALGGVTPHLLVNQPDGTLDIDQIQEAIRNPNDLHEPPSRLVILENTHNRCGGVPLSAEYTRRVAALAHKNGLFLHIDGARIFNAAAALGVTPKELVDSADTVTFCLSKALSAPVGSLLCGPADFIRRSRRIRKQLGGGMRQAGILAAAGIVAIEEMAGRLVEDHRRARTLAGELGGLSGLRVDNNPPASNMVFVSLNDAVSQDAAQIAGVLKEKNQVRVGVVNSRRFRMVTHCGIDDEGVERTIKAFKATLG